MPGTERYSAVVIGAGQAGLSAGYWLSRLNVDYLVVDAGSRIGDGWRQRWDSLQLFTPARYSGLPGMPFPAAPYHLPSRTEVADYLERYAQAHGLRVRLGTRVNSVRRVGERFGVVTDGGELETENVVVATGSFQMPVIPGFARDLASTIFQVHSRGYRNPQQLPPGPALVVGAANSGAQIALELSRTRDVILAGRPVGSLPRRLLGRDIFDWLWPTVMRLNTDSRIGRRLRENVLKTTDRLIGMSERDLPSSTLRRAERVTGVASGKPLVDGLPVNVASVIWCTGFRPDFRWIDAQVFGDDGYPRHERGITAVPGLYFLGLRFLYRLNSSLVGGVGADAEFVAISLAERAGRIRR